MTDILEYKSYYATVHFSAEDEAFHGKIIGINDLVNFEGTTVKQLKAAFHEAVDDYLETCKELGKEPEKTYKGSFNIRISPDLHRQAAQHALLRGISLNDFVKNAIDYMIKKAPDQRVVAWALIILATPASAVAVFFI